MLIIAGLGNPGARYASNRHNIGFMAADVIHTRHRFPAWRKNFQAEVSEKMIDGERVLLMKPQTYMNESGRAVGPLMRWYKIDQPDVYVAYDDMDLAVGRLRIRKSGSDGGHNGIKSLFANGCTDFTRYRVGIGRPLPHQDVVDHVLTPFPEELREAYQQGIEDAATAIEGCLSLGVDKGMNRYNPKKKK